MDEQREEIIIDEAVALAEKWQRRANQLLTAEEKGIQEQMKRLLTHPMDKVVLARLIDRSFRSADPARVADQVNSLLRCYGVPDFFGRVEKLLVLMFLDVGRYVPTLSVPKMIERMRESSSRAIIHGEPAALHAHLEKRKHQGVRMNINHLGEAVLGEEETENRLKTYIKDMENPAIETISVKISTIYSQISSLAFDHTVKVLKGRLTRLFSVAAENTFTRADGTRAPKFVNLDMEEYRDMEITCRAFMDTLDQPELKNVSAGIALQAYLPDAHMVQKDLTEWAKRRMADGGAPIRLRIVKGANMEMELVEAALLNWPPAPYERKIDTDANYKRMVGYGMQPENIAAVHLGVASHNLFELAYAARRAEAFHVTDYFCFEMLEGMVDHVRRAICETEGDMLLYAPVAKSKEFINAIAYLIRRLDENTSPENFLRYAPSLDPASRQWAFLKQQFLDACARKETTFMGAHRTQDRNGEDYSRKTGSFHKNTFANEPDTDWALAANRKWAENIQDRWKKAISDTPATIPVVVAGEEIFDDRPTRDSMDPSQYADGICLARFAMADQKDLDRAVETAATDPDGWRGLSAKDRHAVLSRVAVELRKARGDLIGAAAAETGKMFAETDSEVSEAVDFAEFYPHTVWQWEKIPTIKTAGRGVGVVISPWNFPVAIAAGGITASLAAGNTVVFKPSSAAVLTAWELVQCFWRAGVSKNTLQFVPCDGGTSGNRLTAHPRVAFVILTGGTETGLKILARTPSVRLSAETGGKNATIVTAMADRDQAVKNVIHSAFGHCGQKCSATALLILEKEVYEDPRFKKHLVDAAKSLAVGSAWDLENRMGPLVHRSGGELKQAMTKLLLGESWALKPENIGNNPHLWTPGIKWGVTEGSVTHVTEFFGPLLAVMRADDLAHAIKLANGTGYGLTSGLESLDEREQMMWKEEIFAGNLYINRGTTGAITLRQPFGGMGKSAIGSGIKAGGPDYTSQFMVFEETGLPESGPIKKDRPLLQLARRWEQKAFWGKADQHAMEMEKTARAIYSYLYRWETVFSKEKDFFHLRGQDNLFRYLPAGNVVVRMNAADSLFDLLARVAAARITGCKVCVSIPAGFNGSATDFLFGPEGRQLAGDAEIVFEHDKTLIDRMEKIDRIRYAAKERVPDSVFAAAAKTGLYMASSRVMMEGHVELLHYLRQQAVCNNYHRYGNLGERGMAG